MMEKQQPNYYKSLKHNIMSKELTPMQELIELIPDAYQIKQFISENDADEKMLDEWLFDRIFKDFHPWPILNTD